MLGAPAIMLGAPNNTLNLYFSGKSSEEQSSERFSDFMKDR